jgi:DNA primase
MDVLTAHQHGFTNVVASLGTALTEQQMRLLKRLAKRFALALDADAAGIEATQRGLEVAKEALDYRAVPVPTWKGLIRYEEHLEADLRIIALPIGLDPDDLVREDEVRWRELVDTALPVVDYYFVMITDGLDLESARDKSIAVKQLLSIIAEIGDKVQQAHYIQKLARLVRVDERTLVQQMPPTPALPRLRGKVREEAAPSRPPTMTVEDYYLSLVLREPTLLAHEWALEADELHQPEDRALLIAWRDGFDAEEAWNLDALRETIDSTLRSHLDFLAERLEREPLLTEAESAIEAERCALKIRLRNCKAELEQVQFLLSEAPSSEMIMLGQQVTALEGEIHRLQRTISVKSLLGRREEEREPFGMRLI